MQKYIVIVHGENLLVDYDGVRQRVGFFTNVSVEAFTPADAEERALDIVREDIVKRDLALNAEHDPWRLRAEEVREVESFDPDAQRPGTGLAFYPEDSAGT